MKNLLLLLLIFPNVLIAQISGFVSDMSTGQPVYGAKIVSDKGPKALSDFDGKFSLNVTEFPCKLFISATSYLNDTIEVAEAGEIKILLSSEVQEVKTVVVTAGRRSQDIEEVPISMEIIRPELVDNKGLATLEEAVDQSPGVYTMDSQVSIRGGGGYAYGVGSRVLLLWNGVPMLSGDAGDAKWNSIPMECASQIEVLKGASSVLYGSGALNGIISLSEREPGIKGETRVKIQSGIYDNPKRESLRWWRTDSTNLRNPMFHQADLYYGKMYKNTGFTISTNGYTTDGYKQGEDEDRIRISGTVYIRPEKMKKFKAGVGFNAQIQQNGNFIVWESDTFAYTPSGGADTSNPESTLTYQKAYRVSVDPYVKFFDKANNLHTIKSRYYFIQNNNLTNSSQSTSSGVLFGDYQFQHKWEKGIVVTSGITGIRSDVYSNLMGDHYSNNFAIYSQYEHKIKKMNLTGGLRMEFFEQDGERGDSYFYLNGDSTSKLPVYPIVRLGAHYPVTNSTHLRASFGQGIRYPSPAERYTTTSVGSLNVFANPNLSPETGWAAEIGVKQVLVVKKSWKAMIDIAGFVNQYSNMMEFAFGLFHPATGQRLLTAQDFNNVFAEGYTINEIVGFRAENAEKARISGLEFSFNSIGEIKGVKITSLLGYTYMNPVTLNDNLDYLQTFSSYKDSITSSGDTLHLYDNTLKYRFRHLVKADVEVEWKGVSLGVSCRYNSNMKNIDWVFENEISGGIYVLPGLKAYREKYDKGALVFDARVGYSINKKFRLGFIVNNILNNEYSSRPGDVMAPRNFILQLQMKF